MGVMMAKTIDKKCKFCSEKITVRLADHKRGWGNFCDKSCAAGYKAYGKKTFKNKDEK